MRIAKKDLNLKHLTIITPGKRRYRLEEDIEVVGLYDYTNQLARF